MYEKLKSEMARQNISGYELAKRAYMASSDFYNAIHGKKAFYPAWRKRVADALDVSESELFDDDNNE